MIHFSLSSWIRQFCCIGLICLLTGCGFQLRGTPPLPPGLHTIAIQTPNTYGQLVQQLKQILPSMGVAVVPSTMHPQAILVIESDGFSTVAMLQSASSSTQQYVMYYTIVYHLENGSGKTVFGPKVIKLMQNYSVTQNQVLSTDTEQQTLEQEMQQDAVYQLITQMGSQAAQDALGEHPPA